jgi:predicted dinucleotide-binding enzyme
MTTRRTVITAAAAGAFQGSLGRASAQNVPGAAIRETIAIIGTGRVGAAIGKHWVAAGHGVTFGTRTPTREKIEELTRTIGRAVTVTAIKDAATTAAIILLAVPYRVAKETLAAMGDLTGKIIIDPTNPPAVPTGYPLPANPTLSAAEEIQSWVPGARVIKALNTLNHLVMANPAMGGGPVTIAICGDDADAKARVVRLIAQTGLEPLDVAPLIGARLVEGLARIFSGYRYANPDMTFEIHLRVRPNDLGPLAPRPAK